MCLTISMLLCSRLTITKLLWSILWISDFGFDQGIRYGLKSKISIRWNYLNISLPIFKRFLLLKDMNLNSFYSSRRIDKFRERKQIYLGQSFQSRFFRTPLEWAETIKLIANMLTFSSHLTEGSLMQDNMISCHASPVEDLD